MQIKITGTKLPRYQQRPGTVDPNDAWIRKIMEFEASRGSNTGTGLSNWGYNSRNPKSIEEAISFFKQDYLPKVQQFPMGLRERLGDYAYNTGRSINDLLLYAAGKISLDDINSTKVFTNEWDQYKDEVLNQFNTNPSLFTWKLDKAKDDVYRTTKQINGQPNPSYFNTWNYRANMWDPVRPSEAKPTQTINQLPFFPELNTRPTIDESTIDRPMEDGSMNFNLVAPAPPGFKRDITGKLVIDPTFNESSIERPESDEIPTLTEDELTKRLALLDEQDKKAWGYSQALRDQQAKKRSGIPTASFALAGLRGLGNILSREQDRARREQYGIESGRTDSYFPTVPNLYSRGTEEINTGEFMPNLRTPVQFPGIPAPQFYGMRQYQGGGGVDVNTYVPGASSLLPAMPVSFNNVVDFGYPEASAASTPTVTNSPELETTMVSRGFALPAAPYTFRLASGFGPRKAPKAGASTVHNGNDMGMAIDTPLFSVKDGIVKKVYEDNKGGKQIVIFHPDGTRSGYAHLNAFNVKEGDQVTMGQQIGLSGNTGISTGPHLHFTYGYHDGKKTTKLIDPNSVFKFTEFTSDKKPKNTEVNKLATKILNIVEEAEKPDYPFMAAEGRRNVFGGAIFSNSQPTSFNNTPNIVNSETNSEISYTHRNPLNIHIGDFARQYGAVKGAPDNKGNVAIFPSFDAGIQAAKDLLFGPSYVNLTVEQARNRWVNGDPKKESSSTKPIVKALGSNKKLSELTDAEKDKLIKEFIRWEGKDAYNTFKDFKFYQEGGTFELDDEEIDYILSNGGEIEYL